MYKSVAASAAPTRSSSEDVSSRSSSYCLFTMNSREYAFEKESDTVWLYLSGSKLSQKKNETADAFYVHSKAVKLDTIDSRWE